MTAYLVKIWMLEAGLFGFEWLAEYIAAVAEAYRSHAGFPEGLQKGVQVAIAQLKRLAGCPDERKLKEIIFDFIEIECDSNVERPLEVTSIPFPPRPTGLTEASDSLVMKSELLLQKHGADLERLERLRRPEDRIRGNWYAESALKLSGCFHWTSSGPEGPEKKFAPQTRQSITNTNSEGEKPTHHAEKRNDFLIWITEGGAEPGPQSYMNCWEAIFFSAYKAGFSMDLIRKIHANASQSASKANLADIYYQKLLGILKIHGSFPLIPEIGLMPEPGDIVFVADEFYVTMCVGWQPSQAWMASVQVMSLWTRPRDGFNQVTLADFAHEQDFLRFSPCPF